MDMRMSPGIEQQGEHLPFAFKMGSTGTKGAGNQVVVNPPVSIGSDGAQVAEFSDPNKELFVLRIGKKSEGADKKQTLELELCTPKGPELKPIPRKETRDTQYDNKDTTSLGSKKSAQSKKKK
ncbi:unnamed protein product [Psylliodes chrysocephalus]|uniref:Uncharacterized protein n=1 Tax=Psylliodes chrysocephalus TaxID=3402493 RepID=A0A9P0CJT3_9CUCU|nr:unnamed protein product [Psylliodes chrysocephala]